MNHRDVHQSEQWAWCERGVDPEEDHFELRHGSADSGYTAWVPVARVGRPISRVFGVQFALDRAMPRSAAMIEAAVAELDFYLISLGEPNPWVYAQYHCGTSSNIYSSIHWSFHQAGSKGGKASKVTNPAGRDRG